MMPPSCRTRPAAESKFLSVALVWNGYGCLCMRTGGKLSSPRLGARVERLLGIGNSSAPKIDNRLSAHLRIDSNMEPIEPVDLCP